MIDVINVENHESGNADVTAIVIQEFKVKGKDFDKIKGELNEIFEKYEKEAEQ
ncbi:hypothetical protein HNP89_001473 [Methanococcus maripaludis]|uniref:Uncharacterized protein n=1 Tax=Methanococcus maripaludis TaxID=39152 RepID=A0A7J9P1P7_METMI|nr:hypothetical protein [Methanococcus maripaludis]MBA2853497.1 hypothetical protein [Methanococcus maripaludis]